MLDRAFCFLAMLLLAMPGCAQTPDSSMNPGGRRWEVYGGVAPTGPNSSNARSGGGGGVCGYPISWLGIQGDFSVVQGANGAANTTTLTDFLFGPRLTTPRRRSVKVSPFVDLLFGVQHLNNSSTQHSYYYATGSGSAEALDGGVDVRLTRRLALRAQAGGVFSRFAVSGGLTAGATNVRWRAGAYLVYRF